MEQGPFPCALKIDTDIEVRNNKIDLMLEKPYLNPDLDDQEDKLEDQIIKDFEFPSYIEYSYTLLSNTRRLAIKFYKKKN